MKRAIQCFFRKNSLSCEKRDSPSCKWHSSHVKLCNTKNAALIQGHLFFLSAYVTLYSSIVMAFLFHFYILTALHFKEAMATALSCVYPLCLSSELSTTIGFRFLHFILAVWVNHKVFLGKILSWKFSVVQFLLSSCLFLLKVLYCPMRFTNKKSKSLFLKVLQKSA